MVHIKKGKILKKKKKMVRANGETKAETKSLDF